MPGGGIPQVDPVIGSGRHAGPIGTERNSVARAPTVVNLHDLVAGIDVVDAYPGPSRHGELCTVWSNTGLGIAMPYLRRKVDSPQHPAVIGGQHRRLL